MSQLTLDAIAQSPILKPVHASFELGRVVGVIGPNGAGKSTLLRTIAGTLPPTAGRVYIDGIDVTQQSAKVRARHIAYLPQSMPEDIPYTVREFVEMGRYSYGRDGNGKKHVDDAITQLGLARLADVPLHSLSGGERQRAGIAKCLAQESQVLILDEPISNLDVYYQLDIMHRLQRLANHGRLILLAIHHLEFALRFCNDLLVLRQGEVHLHGAVDKVFSAQMVEEVFGIDAAIFDDPIRNHPRLSVSLLSDGLKNSARDEEDGG